MPLVQIADNVAINNLTGEETRTPVYAEWTAVVIERVHALHAQLAQFVEPRMSRDEREQLLFIGLQILERRANNEAVDQYALQAYSARKEYANKVIRIAKEIELACVNSTSLTQLRNVTIDFSTITAAPYPRYPPATILDAVLGIEPFPMS